MEVPKYFGKLLFKNDVCMSIVSGTGTLPKRTGFGTEIF